jgi:hypothetical protein
VEQHIEEEHAREMPDTLTIVRDVAHIARDIVARHGKMTKEEVVQEVMRTRGYMERAHSHKHMWITPPRWLIRHQRMIMRMRVLLDMIRWRRRECFISRRRTRQRMRGCHRMLWRIILRQIMLFLSLSMRLSDNVVVFR